jgi:hypothetical protein
MATKTKPAKAAVIPFRTRDRLADEEELSVGLPAASLAAVTEAPPASLVDLTGRPKIWFAIGPGRSGKTMLIRWAAEICINRGAAPIVVAADPQNRSLKNYLDVHEPPTNDAAATARWLESLLRYAMGETATDEKASALVDLGGGDTALHKLLSAVPTLGSDLVAAGVQPVAVYTLGPRVDDLAALASFEALGFQPAATAIVLNEGLADAMVPREEAFARVMRHSAYRAAVERGATTVWMPVLNPAELVQEIEGKRLSFIQARDAVSPNGRKVVPIAPFDRSRVRRWLEAMAHEMAPILSWLP